MLDLHRDKFLGLEKKTASIFSRLPLTPNQYTTLSIFSIAICVLFVFSESYCAALVFFIIAGALDFIDGAVARAKRLATPEGAYWDTVADRYIEFILLFGFLFLSLPDFFLPAYAWIFLILFGSGMTTYAKAAASEKKLAIQELKGGLMSRGERMIFYALALFSLNLSVFLVTYILAFLAVATNITAVHRIGMALDKRRR